MTGSRSARGAGTATGGVAGGVSRRAVLRAGTAAAVAAAVVPVAGCGREGPAAGSGQTGRLIPSARPLPRPFTLPLRLPPVSRPQAGADGALVHRLVAQHADLEILPGVRTPALTYGGTVPGPTIESRRGRPTRVEFVNRLTLPTVVHLHGGVTPADSDGFPTDLVLPLGAAGHAGHDPRAQISHGSRRYTYPMDQPAATLWYHDHRMDFTGPMVYRGLAGLHLVRDDVEDGLPLPAGERELPLMIADRSFAADGSFAYPSREPSLLGEPGVTDHAMHGVLGDVLLVNGVPWPVAEVDAARYRLRLINASNARRYRWRLDPRPPSGPMFVQIGSDVGLLERPLAQDRITSAPAERHDVVVDFAQYPVGTRVTLRNELGRGTTGEVMQFVVARRAADDARVPAALAAPAEPLRTTGAVRRTFRFRRGTVGGHRGWTINDQPFDPTRMIASPRAGSVEVWRFGTDLNHPVHVHLGHFTVLSRNGAPPGPMDAGWKDTVDLRALEYVDVAVRFPQITGRYVMHCHNLEHEDMMMMAAFEVV